MTSPPTDPPPRVDSPAPVPLRTPASPSKLKLLDKAGTEGVLLGTRCRLCGSYVFGGIPSCQACYSPEVESVELGTEGTLYSYTLVRTPPPGWQGDVPYLLGQVELPQGPHVVSQVVDCPAEHARIGMKMQIHLDEAQPSGDERVMVVFKWRPAS